MPFPHIFSKTTDAVAIQQDETFAALDETLRIFIKNIAQGQKSIKSLMVAQEISINAHTSEEVAAQTGLIKEHITSEVFSIVHEINKNQAGVHDTAFGITRQACSRLLNSLQNEGLQERRSQVVVSHNGTLEWIYDSKKWDKSAPRSGTSDGIPLNGITEKGHTQPNDYDFNHTCGPASTATFDCFPCWLAERPGQPYWLCGKAGSGKSTLVKFLMGHKKTRRLLKKTHGPTLILSHFFWLSGSPIQRSLQGVALSLLSQFLNQSQIQEDPMEAVMEPEERLWTQKAASVILRAVPGASRNASAKDWSYEELCNAIVALLEASPSVVCIFLDGLDEADTETQSASPKPVLSLVDRLCRIPRVKVCISSRPEPAFQAKFCKQPQLLLQHLTRDDIMTYVIDNFNSQLPADHNSQDGGSPMVQDLAGKVCQYSDGVFLWVRLVMRSLLRGLVNGDTLSQLHERLELLPRDINELYQSMWNRLESEDQEIYHREAALHINMALDGLQLMPHIHFGSVDTHLPLCNVQLFAASNPGEVRKVLLNPSSHSFHTVQSQSIQFGKRLETLTAGLLEVAPVTSPSRYTRQVGFIHRSAREFFVNTIEGKRILAVDESTRVWRLGGLFRGILFRHWIMWYGRVLSLLTQDPISYKVFEDFVSALDQAFDKGFLDREQQLSLIHLCEQAYYTSAHLTGRCTKAVDWKYSDDISRALVETFDFNSFIIRLGNKDILASCLGADFENWKRIAQVMDSDSSERQLSMVYSQNYKAFILYDLLRKHYCGGGGRKILLHNYECILWMLDQGVFDNWPQGKMAAGLTPGLAGASALALLRSFERDFETQYLTILQRCLSLKDAWDENPIFALEESVPRTGVCAIPEHPIVGETTFADQEIDSYLLLTQATMPFVVLAGLDSIHTQDKEALRIAQELKDEAWRRCPDGPSPAKIFMLQWHDNGDDFKKGNCGFLNVSDTDWSTLSFSQFCALSRPGPVGPLEGQVLSVNIEECKKWMSIDELEKEIMGRMMV